MAIFINLFSILLLLLASPSVANELFFLNEGYYEYAENGISPRQTDFESQNFNANVEEGVGYRFYFRLSHETPDIDRVLTSSESSVSNPVLFLAVPNKNAHLVVNEGMESRNRLINSQLFHSWGAFYLRCHEESKSQRPQKSSISLTTNSLYQMDLCFENGGLELPTATYARYFFKRGAPFSLFAFIKVFPNNVIILPMQLQLKFVLRSGNMRGGETSSQDQNFEMDEKRFPANDDQDEWISGFKEIDSLLLPLDESKFLEDLDQSQLLTENGPGRTFDWMDKHGLWITEDQNFHSVEEMSQFPDNKANSVIDDDESKLLPITELLDSTLSDPDSLESLYNDMHKAVRGKRLMDRPSERAVKLPRNFDPLINNLHASVESTEQSVPVGHSAELQRPRTAHLPTIHAFESIEEYAFFLFRSISDKRDTIPLIWEEWTRGVDGKESVEEMDRTWGNQWRSSHSMSSWYNLRRKIISLIRQVAKYRGIPESEAVKLVEDYRITHKQSIRSLRDNMKGAYKYFNIDYNKNDKVAENLDEPRPVHSDRPLFIMSRELLTIPGVWREWTNGINGRPSVIGMEEKWGHRWRNGEGDRMVFYRRKKIITLIHEIAKQKEVTNDEAVAMLEKYRLDWSQSLNQISERGQNVKKYFEIK